MGLKDDIRQRRRQKIKSLLERYENGGDGGGDGRGESGRRSEPKLAALGREEGRGEQGPSLQQPPEPSRMPSMQAPGAWQTPGVQGLPEQRQMSSLQQPPEPSMQAPGAWQTPDVQRLPEQRQAAGAEAPAGQRSERGKSDVVDPELAWKRNPNPWASWDDSGPGLERSFVKPASGVADKYEPPGGGLRSFLRGLKWKSAIAAALFATVWAMYQLDNEWTQKGRAILAEALTEEFDFATAAAWYRDTFAGAPSFIPMFQSNAARTASADGAAKTEVVAPIEDPSLIKTFAELLNGVELAGRPEAPVMAVETGRVIVVTEQGDSVLIQHANNRITIYGKLGGTNVSVNDWVEAGDTIGKLRPADDNGNSLLYFAVKQNDRYTDPLDVIPID